MGNNYVPEAEMIAILKCTPDRFKEYLYEGVFAPCINHKRGRPRKDGQNIAKYDAETVKKAVEDFESGKFTPSVAEPILVFGRKGDDAGKSEGCTQSGNAIRREPSNDGEHTSGQNAGQHMDIQPGESGRVIRFDGRVPTLDEEESDAFDFAKEIGDISTFKRLKRAIIKVTPNPKIPVRVKKDMHATFELLLAARARREAKMKRVPIEKHEADCQKVHDTWATAWKGDAGIQAANEIVSQIETATGKSIRKEFSNINSIIHRAIVDASNRVVQPVVIKILEKI